MRIRRKELLIFAAPVLLTVVAAYRRDARHEADGTDQLKDNGAEPSSTEVAENGRKTEIRWR